MFRAAAPLVEGAPRGAQDDPLSAADEPESANRAGWPRKTQRHMRRASARSGPEAHAATERRPPTAQLAAAQTPRGGARPHGPRHAAPLHARRPRAQALLLGGRRHVRYSSACDARERESCEHLGWPVRCDAAKRIQLRASRAWDPQQWRSTKASTEYKGSTDMLCPSTTRDKQRRRKHV